MKSSYIIEFNNHTKKDFEDVWQIESCYFDPSTISSINKVMEWDNKNNDTNILIRNEKLNKIVGEITMLPLSKKQFDDFILNTFEDTELDAKNLLVYEDNNTYYLLFSAIAIDKNYRSDKSVLSFLLKGINIKINELLKRGIKFENMCAEGQTPDGQKFAESFLNLKEKNISKKGYKIYCFDSKIEMDKWINIFPSYIDKYDSILKKESE